MYVHKFGINPKQLTSGNNGVSLPYIEKHFQRKDDT